MTEQVEHTCKPDIETGTMLGQDTCPACAQAKLWRERIRPVILEVAEELPMTYGEFFEMFENLYNLCKELDQRFEEVKDE